MSFPALAAGDIKGVSPGMSMDEAARLLPGTTCHSVLRAQDRKFFDSSCHGVASYADEFVDISLWAFASVVGKIMVTGNVYNWKAVREGLIAKFGRPSRITPT